MMRALQSRLSSLSSVHVTGISLPSPLVSVAPIPQRFCRVHGRSSILVADIVRGHDALSSNIRSLNGIRAFCTGQDLSMKKCVPCSSKDLRPMTEEAANILIQQVPGWNLVNEGDTWKLHRSWKVKTFVKGMDFLRLVGDIAEAEVMMKINH